MKTLLLTALLLTELSAQSLPVVPLQMDPDQLARSLRERMSLMPEADCKALEILECQPNTSARVMDMSVRWVQLDNDPDLETVFVVNAPSGIGYGAYVFDKQRTWNLVGSFFCRDPRCDGDTIMRVEKLTEDSPPLLLYYHDLGGIGSGSTLLTTEGFQLRGGKLWPAFEVTNYEEAFFATPLFARRRRVLASPNRLVIHTIREEPPGQLVQNRCEVWRWDAERYAFVPVANEQTTYCDPETGKPLAGKSHLTRLPGYP
jgi:hypothetical protein